jgi:hypothetical protein
MGFMFYPTGGVEAGIDGFIELRDEETGAVGNLLLQVQGKSTERQRLQAETEDTFEFPCSEADISYWMQGTAPVLFIVVRLQKGAAFWKSIKAWFSDPDRLKGRKIVFDKKVDLFTREAKAAVTAVALSTVPGATAPGMTATATLTSSLSRRIATRSDTHTRASKALSRATS